MDTDSSSSSSDQEISTESNGVINAVSQQQYESDSSLNEPLRIIGYCAPWLRFYPYILKKIAQFADYSEEEDSSSSNEQQISSGAASELTICKTPHMNCQNCLNWSGIMGVMGCVVEYGHSKNSSDRILVDWNIYCSDVKQDSDAQDTDSTTSNNEFVIGNWLGNGNVNVNRNGNGNRNEDGIEQKYYNTEPSFVKWGKIIKREYSLTEIVLFDIDYVLLVSGFSKVWLHEYSSITSKIVAYLLK